MAQCGDRRGRGRGGRGRRANPTGEMASYLWKSSWLTHSSARTRWKTWKESLPPMTNSAISFAPTQRTAACRSEPLKAIRYRSMVAELELKQVLAGSPDCPAEAVHGSYFCNWSCIQQQGLSRMKRTHIHLAPGLPGEDGVISGMRKDCDLAVYVDIPKALADGIKFFWSENGVLLTEGNTEGMLLPKYFSRALRLRPTRVLLPLQ
ncbi:tRNA 2'-phosphotransferase 1 isoform X2 [Nelusetta ayraudi]|uniref:tRNA 2'-phosphotransferase 1 isoform X2 n=1 Tax=Nelusetta ayraudi TaxID=303726 RepID=UPI003F7259D0